MGRNTHWNHFSLNPITGTAAALGAILAAFVVSFLGEGIIERVIKWRYKDKDLKREIFIKYGINMA